MHACVHVHVYVFEYVHMDEGASGGQWVPVEGIKAHGAGVTCYCELLNFQHGFKGAQT